MHPNPRRQADHVLAAFRFQLIQTAIAWLSLSPGETLLIEHVEDYDTLDSEGNLRLGQAKYSGIETKLTLASKAAVDALSNFWEASSEGKLNSVHLVLQTNVQPGNERGISFPDGIPGILYWEEVKLGAPLGPLRDALVAVLPAGSLRAWVESAATDGDLFEKLVKPISWHTGLAAREEQTALLAEQIAGRLASLAIPVGLTGSIVRQLSDRVFEKSTQQDPSLRRLDAESLNRFLLETTVHGHPSSIAGWTLAPDTIELDVDLDLRRTAPRNPYVQNLQRVLDDAGALWLHGASGCGKTTLGRQLAASTGQPWLLIEFRELTQVPDVLQRINRLYTDLVVAGRTGGIILDDVAADTVVQYAERFARLCKWMNSKNIKVVLTCSHPISPPALGRLGLGPASMVGAAYLELEDVKYLVREAGAPTDMEEGWAVLIHATCAIGHPQLVAARIASLKQRRWPREALLEDFGGVRSDATVLTRTEARRRLVMEATEPGRALLKRLDCVVLRFDRELAIAVASVDPRVHDPAQSLDFLVGPWIEQAPGSGKYLRLSPLLHGLSEDVPIDLANKVRTTAAVNVASRGPMNFEELDIVFWNSFVARDAKILMRLLERLETMPSEQFKVIAVHLSPIAFFRTDVLLLEENLFASIMLRILQLSIAAENGYHEIFSDCAQAALTEVQRVADPMLRPLLELSALMKILFAQGTKVAWRLRFEWISRLELGMAAHLEVVAPADNPAIVELRREFGDSADLPGFLVALGAQTINTPSELKELFDALDALPDAARWTRLRQLKAIQRGYGLPVQQGWANAWSSGHLNPNDAIRLYGEMEEMASRWGDQDLAAECIVAQAILADEHLGTPETALHIVDEGLAADPDNHILVRQKAKLLGHLGRYDEAAPLLFAIQTKIAGESKIELMYLLREAAIAAACLNKFDEAYKYFTRAASAAKAVSADIESIQKYYVAFLGEAALCLWWQQLHVEGILAMQKFIELLDGVNPREDNASYLLHAKARYAVGWMDAASSLPSRAPPVLEAGALSALDGDASKKDDNVYGNLNEIRLLLRIVGLRYRLDGVYSELDFESLRPGFLVFLRAAELDLRYDVCDPLAIGRSAVRLYRAFARANSAFSIQRTDDGGPEGVAVAFISYPEDDPGLQMMLSSVIAISAYRAFLSGYFSVEWFERLAAACRDELKAPDYALSELTELAKGLRKARANDVAEQVIATILGSSVEVAIPANRIKQHLNIISATLSSAAGISTVRTILRTIAAEWRFACNCQRFLFTSPVRDVPEIVRAIEKIESDQPGGLAALMAAAAAATRSKIDEAWTAIFDTVGGKES